MLLRWRSWRSKNPILKQPVMSHPYKDSVPTTTSPPTAVFFSSSVATTPRNHLNLWITPDGWRQKNQNTHSLSHTQTPHKYCLWGQGRSSESNDQQERVLRLKKPEDQNERRTFRSIQWFLASAFWVILTSSICLLRGTHSQSTGGDQK